MFVERPFNDGVGLPVAAGEAYRLRTSKLQWGAPVVCAHALQILSSL